jgi:DNA-binding MarR family transcriptional regulator
MKRTTRKAVAARKGARSKLTVTIPGLVRSGRDAEFREMISVVYGALGRLQTMRRTLAEALDLGSAEFAVVMTLLRLESNTGVRVRRIADDLYVAAANITATVGRLEETNWVVKAPDPTDSRALAIRLTAEARQRLQNFADQLHLVNDVWFQGITSNDLRSVILFFHRLIDQYEPALAAARSIARTSSSR